MKTLLGQKVGMTRAVDKRGRLVGATVIEARPNAITLHRTTEQDGYNAIQIGFGDVAKARKPQRRQLAKSKAASGKYLVEVRIPTPLSDESSGGASYPLGSELTVSLFKAGDIVNVVATSKGHGFAGTVKRHNFKIGPRSHGSMNQRRPGSIGAQQPQRVILGKRMGGHLGAERVTIKHLEVLDVLPGENLLVIKGAVPGIKGALVQISASPRHQTIATQLAKEAA